MAHKGRAIDLPDGIKGLPVQVVTPSDVGRLIREMETVDTATLQATLSGKGHQPKLTSMLERTATLNGIDMAIADDRTRLQQFLTSVKQSAPVLTISFSTDPQIAFLEKLVAWLRQEIDELVLIKIGLQPNIGAGCVVRSTNKYFDLSLRKDFDKGKATLLAALNTLSDSKSPVSAESSKAKV